MKYFCNAKIFKTLEYDKRLKSGLKEGVLISQLHLVIDKKFFHHSSLANNPANSYYVHQKFFTSNINDFQIRSRKIYIGSLVFSFSRQFHLGRHYARLLHNVQLPCIGKITKKSSFLCKSSLDQVPCVQMCNVKKLLSPRLNLVLTEATI